ncbi:hypothetical protein H2198_008692 [Neophaeococcomyces mojaviensis]|uniref:Uncharacterized protein n=1 Tax=Neophaeococcomyces mojaviensis TaxID=3383035 RepID=A0ACC2ZWS9_9EURO|nr:hypothetical protein H2198_008692 [Knufia sp. JES_112]
MEESQQWMNRYLPPNDVNTYDLMLWAKEDSKPWEHIGVIGCHIMSPVPHIGYMLRTEWWGRSIATKALQVFLEDWWKLERKEVEVSTAEAEDEYGMHLMALEMNQSESDINADETVPEILLAEIEENNIGSVRVITKCGFQYRGCKTIHEKGQSFVLLEYTLSRPH